jgi:hypothetical protein
MLANANGVDSAAIVAAVRAAKRKPTMAAKGIRDTIQRLANEGDLTRDGKPHAKGVIYRPSPKLTEAPTA